MKKINRLVVIVLLTILLFPTMTSASIFTDVSEKEWYYPYLVSNQKNEIITGYPDGTFRPNEPISRAQAALIISRIMKLPEVGDFKLLYTDVSTEHYAYNEIAKLTKAGIFINTSNFNPNNSLTRAQFSKIIVLMYDFDIKNDVEVPFLDIPSNHWAKQYISFLAKTGITTGTTKTSFSPTKPVTRAQAIVLLDKSAKYNLTPSTKEIIYDPYVKEYTTINQANSKFVSETINLVNIERNKKGLSPLIEDTQLTNIAFVKAQDMVKNKYFEHISKRYGAPWDMADGFGYYYKTFGENIAHGYESSNEVVTAWMNSQGHRANILNSKYTRIGVGISLDNYNQYYFVHMFSSK